MKIVIIGAGGLGRAIGRLLKDTASTIAFWDTDTSKVPGQKPLQETVPSAHIVFFCVPSWGMRAALRDVLPFLNPGSALVSFAKGIEQSSGKTMPELCAELAPQRPFGMIDGPMLAGEISAGQTPVGVIASHDEGLRRELYGLLASSRFRVEVSEDALGFSLAGVLKNIYAVSLGIADGLRVSGNEKGWLVAQAIQEMVAIGKTHGVDERIVLGTAGVGDLIATGFSPFSHNRQAGEEIAKSGTRALQEEGIVSLLPLTKRLGAKAAGFLLLNLVKDIAINGRPARAAFEGFFSSDPHFRV